MDLNLGKRTSSLEEFVVRSTQKSYPQQNTVIMPDFRGNLGAGFASGCDCKVGPIFIPTPSPCSECGTMERDLEMLKDRVLELENLIGEKTDTVIAMTDTNNNEVSIVVLAEQEA